MLVKHIPIFLVSEQGSIRLAPTIDLDDKTLLPMPLEGHVTKPYVFDSADQLWQIVEKCRTMTLHSIYKDVKNIWRKYIDAEDFHLSICGATTIFAYFQDKIGLTHYLFFIGGNNSGKSNNLRVLHFLGYRNMMSTDITAANIYQMLGNVEEGMGTLCEDEADDIDENREKMKIYKNGYASGFKVMRIDMSNGRKQHVYDTYCFKAFAAERLPDVIKAKGFNQRIIELPCVFGFPQYDISEVVNPAGEQKFQSLLDELNSTRNSLLVYRLLHFHEPISNIELHDMTGRESSFSVR